MLVIIIAFLCLVLIFILHITQIITQTSDTGYLTHLPHIPQKPLIPFHVRYINHASTDTNPLILREPLIVNKIHRNFHCYSLLANSPYQTSSLLREQMLNSHSIFLAFLMNCLLSTVVYISVCSPT